MQLKFNDGTTLAIQKATALGGGLQVLVAERRRRNFGSCLQIQLRQQE